MRLIEAQATLYKNIVNSGHVTFDEHVTALVGKNESGKTSFLQALYALNPEPAAGIRFDVTNDYPRWRKIRDERKGDLSRVPAITASFSLTQAEIEAISAASGVDLPPITQVRVERRYNNDLVVWLDFENEADLVASLIDRTDLGDDIAAVLEGIGTLVDLATKLETLRAQSSKERSRRRTTQIDDFAEEIKSYIAATEPPLPQNVVQEIKARLPKFFYFSDYSLLEGRIDLQELASRISSQNSLTPNDRTTLALLNLAGVTPQQLMVDSFEVRKAQLEAAANEVSRQVFDYWSQNTELEVDFVTDSAVVDPGSSNPRVVHKYLDIRLRDLRHGMTTNFNTRSSGFRWFFSFIAAFSEYERNPNVIVLLDEPGLGLHGRAQANLLRFIDTRLAADNQVIYTTHSPFMVDATQLERVRLVEDRSTRSDPEQGSTVSSSALSVSGDTLFPLQAALGYDLAQNLFVGNYNLIVEGPADFIYLQTLSTYLRSIGRNALDPRWTIVPVGGIDKVPTFIALLGSRLPITVLIDSRSKPNQRLSQLVSQGLIKNNHLVSVGQAFIEEKTNADIEDLFCDSEYLLLFNSAHRTSLKPDAIYGEAPVLQRITGHIGSNLDHLLPAMALLSSKDDSLSKLSEETLSRFERLFGLINSTIEA